MEPKFTDQKIIEISSKNKYVESRLRSIRLSTVKERSEKSDTPPAMECRGIN
jgi:hypothetical protein